MNRSHPISIFLGIALGLTPVGLGIFHGGYFPSSWLVFASALAAFLLAVRVGGGARYVAFRAHLSPGVLVSIAPFGLFAAWNLLSAVWAIDAPAALMESTRVILYGLVLTATIAIVRTGRDARLVLTSYVLGSGILAAITLLVVVISSSPENYFRWIKLTEPIGYYNAEATFFLMPSMIAVHLASARDTARWLRPLLLPCAVVLLQVTILTQSRGGFWAFVAALAMYFALVPHRPRALLWWAPVLALVAYGFGSLNNVHIVLDEGDASALIGTIDTATNVVAATALAAALLAGILTLLDLRIALGRRGMMVTRAVTAAVFVGLLILVPVRFPSVLHPVAAAHVAWDQFKGAPSPPSEVRILNLDGSRRYELWQVAWRAFEDSPGHGVGADNYYSVWNRTRPLAHDVLQPHNLYLRLLSELGLPGLLLFLGAVLTAGAASLWRGLRAPRGDRALVIAILAACAVFLVHASADWIWHMPAVGTAFFILLGLLVGSTWAGPGPRGRPDSPEIEPPERGAARNRRPLLHYPTPIAAMTLTASVLIILAVPQFISISFSDRATSLLAQGEPELALRAAGWAARANPLADEPHVVAGRAQAARGDVEAADAEFLIATHKNPANWHTYVVWGDVVASTGGDAHLLYETALRLNPLSPEIRSRLE